MSREEREICLVSTWQLPATESFKQIHLARSDMKSRLQVPGSLGLPKLTDWQQKESASRTLTAQSPSMEHRGRKAVGKGRPGRARSQAQGLLYSQLQWRDSIFSPVQPSPSLLLAAHFTTKAFHQPKHHQRFFVHAMPAPSSSPWPFPLSANHWA